MPPQLTLLPESPTKRRLRPVKNAPGFGGGDVLAWLKGGQYRGNKPDGGLWTSSATPGEQYSCDWVHALNVNRAVQLAYPPGPVHPVHPLRPRADARVILINSLDDARGFTARFHRATLPLPPEFRQGMARLITRELTDWERAFGDYDAVWLTTAGADELAWAAMEHGVDTAFHTWNCESTLWGRWCFE